MADDRNKQDELQREAMAELQRILGAELGALLDAAAQDDGDEERGVEKGQH